MASCSGAEKSVRDCRDRRRDRRYTSLRRIANNHGLSRDGSRNWPSRSAASTNTSCTMSDASSRLFVMAVAVSNSDCP